jgi:recombination DNA repair RAD52 pathway protein
MNDEQMKQLFKPINPARVAKHPHNHSSYLETWDVIAHLGRIFGPLNWDKRVLREWLIFETEGKNKKDETVWTACYGATVQLSIGGGLKVSEDCATGTAINQPSRGDAHDLALKTAVSDALKRCAKDLGNQFGLSLYDKGATDSRLSNSLAHPDLES